MHDNCSRAEIANQEYCNYILVVLVRLIFFILSFIEEEEGV